MGTRKSEAAERVRNFLAFCRTGILSTHSVRCSGYPFGSVVPYDLNPAGEVVIFISDISEHYKNLDADNRAGLFVMDPFTVNDPQPNTRLSLVCDFEKVSDSERAVVETSYFKRFPAAESQEQSHGFFFFRGKTRKLRWIEGFGSMGWLSGEELNSATTDPISYSGLYVADHMNNDHADSVTKLAKRFGNLEKEPTHAKIVFVSSGGYLISCVAENREVKVEVPFVSAPTSLDDVRKQTIAMLKE